MAAFSATSGNSASYMIFERGLYRAVQAIWRFEPTNKDIDEINAHLSARFPNVESYEYVKSNGSDLAKKVSTDAIEQFLETGEHGMKTTTLKKEGNS